MRLHYVVQGEGPPLIILHGFLGSSDNWRMMSKRFAAHYRTFSVDLRNHGRSPHSEVMNYPVMVQDLDEFFDEHRLSTAFLLGHSMGGKVAMRFAGEFPERANKLIVVDIAPKAYPPSDRALLAALQNLDLSAVKSYAEADAALAREITKSMLRQFLVKNLSRDDAGNFYWHIPLDTLAANYDDLVKSIAIKIPFSKPALFLRGGRSRFIEADIELIRENFPQAQIQTIPNAGHWLHVEAPDEFYRAVSGFLARA